VFIAEAEKATLQADVASIFAEIMTKQLSATKLGVGRAEIAAGYTYIQSKLDDALAQMDTKELIEAIRTESEIARTEEINLMLAVEKAAQDLKLLQEEYSRQALTYEVNVTAGNIAQEESIRNQLVAAKLALNEARTDLVVRREGAQSSAASMVSAAQVSARIKFHTAFSDTTSIEHISG
jgi:transglutaminase/protease-like cytokinesis protein 3